MGRRKGYGHPFVHEGAGDDAARERTRRLQQGFWDALGACGMDNPRALAAEIDVSERTARRYINDPATVTEDAYQKMLGSDRMGAFILNARFGGSIEHAREYASRTSVFDPEIPAMAKRLVVSFLSLGKENMRHVLACAEGLSSVRTEQSLGEIVTCNWVRGRIINGGFMTQDELPLDTPPTA